jgi:hypothetical protein
MLPLRFGLLRDSATGGYLRPALAVFESGESAIESACLGSYGRWERRRGAVRQTALAKTAQMMVG